MSLDGIREICLQLPSVTEDIKWGNDLCYSIGGKMFCVVVLTDPIKISIKVGDDQFSELCCQNGIVPAPYAARHHWILVEDITIFRKKEWITHTHHSYELIKTKLPKKVLRELNGQ